MPELKKKWGFGKVTKWTVLKFTGLALTVAFAVNINNTTNRIERKQIVQGEVLAAKLDSSATARLELLLSSAEGGAERDSALVRIAEQLAQPSPRALRDSTVLRYFTVPRDSVVIRHKLVLRESTVVVWDTLKTAPDRTPLHWERFRGAGHTVF